MKRNPVFSLYNFRSTSDYYHFFAFWREIALSREYLNQKVEKSSQDSPSSAKLGKYNFANFTKLRP